MEQSRGSGNHSGKSQRNHRDTGCLSGWPRAMDRRAAGAGPVGTPGAAGRGVRLVQPPGSRPAAGLCLRFDSGRLPGDCLSN